MKTTEKKSNNDQILIYQNADGNIKVDVRLEDETIWLSQKAMAQLFDCTPENILIHLKNVYETRELEEKATTKDFLVVQKEGNRKVSRNIKHYNLDTIISIGYRVSSGRATQFRIWATQKIKDYIIKGFVLNDDRFKSGNSMNYFTELQDRIREIRLSERFFYQKINLISVFSKSLF